VINEISEGPTERYFQEYKRANQQLEDISNSAVEYLKKHAKKVIAIQPTVEKLDYQTLRAKLSHKMIATLAGLGWIGKSDLLITEQFGPAIRLSSILTDARFEAATPIKESKCGQCSVCVEHCPADAISGTNWQVGYERNIMYDAFKCCNMTKKLSNKIGHNAHICGICINICPWTQKYISHELTS